MLAMLALIGVSYLIELQTYVLRLELALDSIYIAFLGFELLFSFWAAYQFSNHDRF